MTKCIHIALEEDLKKDFKHKLDTPDIIRFNPDKITFNIGKVINEINTVISRCLYARETMDMLSQLDKVRQEVKKIEEV